VRGGIQRRRVLSCSHRNRHSKWLIYEFLKKVSALRAELISRFARIYNIYLLYTYMYYRERGVTRVSWGSWASCGARPPFGTTSTVFNIFCRIRKPKIGRIIFFHET